jgi:hypothetical protein
MDPRYGPNNPANNRCVRLSTTRLREPTPNPQPPYSPQRVPRGSKNKHEKNQRMMRIHDAWAEQAHKRSGYPRTHAWEGWHLKGEHTSLLV